jgi:hypothetical protein
VEKSCHSTLRYSARVGCRVWPVMTASVYRGIKRAVSYHSWLVLAALLLWLPA